MSKANLSVKMRRFVEAYAGPAGGNATEAARLAGYKGNATTLAAVGAENLRKPHIAEAIRGLAEKETKESIATIEECKAILTRIARNPKAEDKDVIASIDKLLKTHGGYRERRELNLTGAKVVAYLPENGRART